MGRKKVSYPFEASVSELRKYADLYVDSVFSCLESEFLVLPRGPGFVDYDTFEAKLTEDDGTARDKVARIQRLDALRREGRQGNKSKYELVACIGGRGFGVRREDMRRLLAQYSVKG